MYINQMLQRHKDNDEYIAPGKTINIIPDEVIELITYLDTYEDEFISVNGVSYRGFAILDNFYWTAKEKLHKDKKTYQYWTERRSQAGHYYFSKIRQ